MSAVPASLAATEQPPACDQPAFAAPAALPHGRAGPVAISCVIPCHNEARNLDRMLPLLSEVLASLSPQWEIVMVDDGSTDHTAAVMEAWAALPGFRAIQLSRNFGKEAALTAGLRAARGDVVAMLDADLQHPPELVAQMLARWRAGADVVYAVRSSRSDEPVAKRLGARLFYFLLNRFDRFDIPAGAGDFRLLDRRVVDALLALPERNRFMKGLYAWVGFDAVALPYEPAPRAFGRSRFSPLRLVALSLDGLTGFASWPLRIVGGIGIAVSLASFAYGLYLIATYLLYGHAVSGWTTIVVALMFFSGMQMVFLGIIGEYIARIFEEVKARPLYVVKREAGTGLPAASS